MKRLIIVSLLAFCVVSLSSQTDKRAYSEGLSAQIDSVAVRQYRKVESFFDEAYARYPSVPRGMLEAVSFAYTRFTHLSHLDQKEEDGGVPEIYGLMGLTLDGRGFFLDNLRYVADLSGFPVGEIISSPRTNVLAYAAAYAALQQRMGISSNRFDEQLPILSALSELPQSDQAALEFALHSSLYAIAWFVDNDLFRSVVRSEVEKPDYERCFGPVLPLLRSAEVKLPLGEEYPDRSGDADYEGAIWNPAGTCNYSEGRGGHAISAVAIHYTQGTYAGAIAWFQNCTYNGVGARASAHYVVRSIDGQVTQMVRETDKAWHVGNCNPYTVGIEHEAYGDIASFFTPAMYQSSARLVRDICDRNGISPHRMFYRDTLDNGTVLNSGLHSLGGESACVKIRGHQHFPNQSHTDPGPFWNWNYYYKLVNDDTPVIRLDAPSGVLTDSGGPDEDYGNDERQLWLIQVDESENITLTFSEFDLENDYDFLWIYDGSTVYAPLLGRWNTVSPGTVSSSGNALLVEFRSDCATTAAGWKATWKANGSGANQRPVTELLWDERRWVTGDFTLCFDDRDDGEIPYRFYQVTGYDGEKWTTNPNRGFIYDDFERMDSRLRTVVSGDWHCEGGRLLQSGLSSSEMVLPLAANTNCAYLYEFDMDILSCLGEGARAGVRILQAGAALQMNAYTIMVFPEERKIRIYHVQHGVQTLLYEADGVDTQIGLSYHYKIIHDAESSQIAIFRDGLLLGRCRDYSSSPSFSSSSKMALVTSGTSVSFGHLRVYRSRGDAVEVAVGGGRGCDILWQASDGIPTSKVRSVVVDDQWLFSEVSEKHIMVDFTAPAMYGSVKNKWSGNVCEAASIAAVSDLRLWPNPVFDVLNVVSSQPLGSLSVFDAFGQRVYVSVSYEGCAVIPSDRQTELPVEQIEESEKQRHSSMYQEVNQMIVDVSKLKAGIYFVRVVGRGGEMFGASFVKL